MHSETAKMQIALVKGEICMYERQLKHVACLVCRGVIKENLRYARQELARRNNTALEWDL